MGGAGTLRAQRLPASGQPRGAHNSTDSVRGWAIPRISESGMPPETDSLVFLEANSCSMGSPGTAPPLTPAAPARKPQHSRSRRTTATPREHNFQQEFYARYCGRALLQTGIPR